MVADGSALSALARAKINLTLHLCGQRSDGYHLLDSLVVFPEIGDFLTAEPATGLSLSLDGPFGQTLSAAGDNLVLKAAEQLSNGNAKGAALHLQKNLPVASGIGGGSSNAATALALLSRMWDVQVPNSLALSLGADVPVCQQAPKAHRMQGIGDNLTLVPNMPDFWIVLVNPMVSVQTSAVFTGTPDKSPPSGPEMPSAGFHDFATLCSWLAQGRNDLEPAAAKLCPEIPNVLAALADAPLARMSGSGATCFAIYADQDTAAAKSDALRGATDWWIASGPVHAGLKQAH
ncbi:MAG: 4-(cytidine 5'-diphospho)-2-C-methyl-D-erythritol kinase [Pseudomonadota bacterium]